MDIARDDLPGGFGPFDVVFCIDTLEHVSSAEATLAAIGKHLAAGPRSRAFVSVFNPRHPSNVSAEPHYGVPAMVLLPRDDARDLWNDVRGAFGSSLEYEVSDWVPYRELAGILRRVGLASSLFVDSHPALDRSRPFWAGFRERIDELEARVAAGIDGLRTRPALRELLRARLRRYCAGYLQDHEDLASTADAPDAGAPRLLHGLLRPADPGRPPARAEPPLLTRGIPRGFRPLRVVRYCWPIVDVGAPSVVFP